MSDASNSRTSATLLNRLRCSPDDPAAWREFVRRYGPRLYQWCRRWGLQEADAEDVTQDVLLKLSVKLRDFHYDPAGSFRGWLKTLAHHAWQDFVEGRRRARPGSGDSAQLALLDTVAAREDLTRRLEEEFDQELLEQAMERVPRRVAPQTWEAFRLTATEGLSGAEAATRVGMQIAMVFRARSKVQKMLREEIERLERPAQPAGGPSHDALSEPG